MAPPINHPDYWRGQGIDPAEIIGHQGSGFMNMEQVGRLQIHQAAQSLGGIAGGGFGGTRPPVGGAPAGGSSIEGPINNLVQTLSANTAALKAATAEIELLPAAMQELRQSLRQAVPVGAGGGGGGGVDAESPNASTPDKARATTGGGGPTNESAGTAGAETPTASQGFASRLKSLLGGGAGYVMGSLGGDRYAKATAPDSEASTGDKAKAFMKDMGSSTLQSSFRSMENYLPFALYERHRAKAEQAKEMAGSLVPNLGDASTLGYSSRGTYVGSGEGPGAQIPFTSAASQAEISQRFERMKYALMPGVRRAGADAIFNNLYGLGWTSGGRTNSMRENLAHLTQQNFALGTSPQTATMMDQATRYANYSMQDFLNTMQQVPHVAQQTQLGMNTVLQSMQDYQNLAVQQGANPGQAQAAGLQLTQNLGMPFSAVQPALESPLGNAMMLQRTGLSPLTMGAAYNHPGVVAGAASQTITGLYQQMLPQFQDKREPDGTVITAQEQAQAAVSRMTGVSGQYVQQFTQQKGTARQDIRDATGNVLARKGQPILGGTEMQMRSQISSQVQAAQQHLQWIQTVQDPKQRAKYLQQFEQGPYGPKGVLASMQKMRQADPNLYGPGQMAWITQRLSGGAVPTPQQMSKDQISQLEDIAHQHKNWSSAQDYTQWATQYGKQHPTKTTLQSALQAVGDVGNQVNAYGFTSQLQDAKQGKSIKAGNVTIGLDPQTAQYFSLMQSGAPPSSSAVAKAASQVGAGTPNQGFGGGYNNPGAMVPGLPGGP